MANVEVDQFANRIIDLDIYTTDEFQHALFGQSAFQREVFRGDWRTFQRLDGWREPTCFHGFSCGKEFGNAADGKRAQKHHHQPYG